ncbi:MAG: hypothetical protein M0Q45_03255 [Bacteroidales bacterium]|nr:hypothetical protein [Bacteroidales bacterium]MCK9498504.1 hypothetical protein [Bacteroidales bacterium]MDY0314001.1 hypothetical protein [Bacteroidales bacterium]
MKNFISKYYKLKKQTIVVISIITLFYACDFHKNSNQNNKLDKQEFKFEDDFILLNKYFNYDTDSAELLAFDLEKKYASLNETAALVRLYGFLSELYQYRKKDDFTALINIAKAIELYISNPNLNIENDYLFINAGNILLNYGMQKEAINVYKQTKLISNANSNSIIYSIIDNNIGLAYQAMANCDSSMYYYRLAETEIPYLGITTYLKQIQSNNYKISLSLECNLTDSIPFYFNEIKKKFEIIDRYFIKIQSDNKKQNWENIKIEYYTNKVRSLHAVGRYFILLNQEENALEMFKEAVRFAKLSGNSSWIISSYQGWADACFAKGYFNECVKVTDTAISKALITTKDYKTLSELYEQKNQAQLKLGNNESAKISKYQSDLYIDSLELMIISEENISKRIELAINPINIAIKNFELRKSQLKQNIEKEVIIFEQENYIKNLKIIIISLASLIIAGIIVLLILIKKKKRTNKQQDLLKLEQEIENINLYFYDKNQQIKNNTKNLIDLQESLKSLLINPSEREKEEIKKAISKNSTFIFYKFENISLDKNKEIINDKFFTKLFDKFPNLSEKDRQLFAYIKLKLPISEIAKIQNSSERSINTNIYNLRRKLSFETDNALITFIQGF